MAAVLLALGVAQGDRVLIYMPMVPEAAFAMLACARIGAIHSVVFGGFASVQPGQPDRRCRAEGRGQRRRGQPRRQGHRLQAAARRGDRAWRGTSRQQVLLVDRGLAPMTMAAGRDQDYAALRERASRRAGAVCLGRIDASELHALHERHDRPAEGRAARHRRLRGGAGREHEAHLLRQRRRDLLLDQRHRLGRRPQLHRLRAADRRHGDDHVRGPADPARRRRSGGAWSRSTRSPRCSRRRPRSAS